MLPRATLLILGLLVAGLPVASSTSPTCLSSPPQDQTLLYPLKDGVYLYVNASDSARSGFWEETNGVHGLQIQDCVNAAHGVEYRADKFDGAAIPPGQLL